MEQFVVGGNGCLQATIIHLASNSGDIASLGEKYEEFLYALKLLQPSASRGKIDAAVLQLKSIEPIKAFETLLTNWSRKYKSEAKLQDLVNSLLKIELLDTANVIRKYYLNQLQASSQEDKPGRDFNVSCRYTLETTKEENTNGKVLRNRSYSDSENVSNLKYNGRHRSFEALEEESGFLNALSRTPRLAHVSTRSLEFGSTDDIPNFEKDILERRPLMNRDDTPTPSQVRNRKGAMVDNNPKNYRKINSNSISTYNPDNLKPRNQTTPTTTMSCRGDAERFNETSCCDTKEQVHMQTLSSVASLTEIMKNWKVYFGVGLLLSGISMYLHVATYLYFLTGSLNVTLDQIQFVKKQVTMVNTNVKLIETQLTLTPQNNIENTAENFGTPENATFHVYSYAEYQQQAYEHPGRNPTELFIQLRNKDDWPTRVPMYNKDTIQKLTVNGAVSKNVLVGILRETRHIELLHIINSEDYGICSLSSNDTNQIGNKSQIILQNLRVLHFEGFDSCNHVYSLFQHHMQMSALRNLTLRKCTIDKLNVATLRRLLQINNELSLQKISFPMTKWKVNLFSGKDFTLRQVNNLHIDLNVSNIDFPIQKITKSLKDHFPNLKTFTSLNCYIAQQRFSEILSCQNLFNVTVGLLVPNVTRVNILDKLKGAPASLQFVDIKFRFTDLRAREECTIDGVAEAIKKYTLGFGDNC